MDRTGIIVVTLCVILLGIWFVEQQKYAPPPRPQPQPVSANTPASTTTTANASAVSPAPAPATTPVFDTNTPEQLLVLTNARARYTFTSRGGGLQRRHPRRGVANGGGSREAVRFVALLLVQCCFPGWNKNIYALSVGLV